MIQNDNISPEEEEEEEFNKTHTWTNKVSTVFREMVWPDQVVTRARLGVARVSASEIALSQNRNKSSPSTSQLNEGSGDSRGSRIDRNRQEVLDRQIRLKVANRFLHEAKMKTTNLENTLKKRSYSYEHRFETVGQYSKRVVKEWVTKLNITELTRISNKNNNHEDNNEALNDVQKESEDNHAELLAQLQAEAALLRQENLRAMAEEALGESASHLRSRSEILRHFISNDSDSDHQTKQKKQDELIGCGGLLNQLLLDVNLFVHVTDPRW
eukprot:CAMPEP_0114337524 /NCGR_PEP_ID=MMETSP0101-20121206/6413_1 /TAXON_ID=38822 ORGANISM="Pteridomonas danica, Strain PT" /NCGR_SAMPLE_ID=MMETSP0101 /ASSEMBLY_ACC=CAM_ASM_000211 /LENGTH=269 /DNA_ID=CAMNT_0001469773 /DNA_START=1142 /DNA_END=1948 /DNA_ORIENTATION=+